MPQPLSRLSPRVTCFAAIVLVAASLPLAIVRPATAQPTLVRDINPNSGSVPAHLTAFDGALFFVANDGSSGAEVW